MIRVALFLILLTISGQSWAVAYAVTGHRVTMLSTGWSGEGLYVDSEGSLPAGANCGDGNRFIIVPAAPMQREMVSLLMMAIQSQVPVNLYVDGCYNGVMKLKSVAIARN